MAASRTDRGQYTVKDKAYLLTYMDLCKKNGKDYKDEIKQDFTEFSRRSGITFDTIRNQMRTVLLECGMQTPSVKQLALQGTPYIIANKGKFSEELVQEMNSMRLKWGLDELSTNSPVTAQCETDVISSQSLSSRTSTATDLGTPIASEVVSQAPPEPLSVPKTPQLSAASDVTVEREVALTRPPSTVSTVARKPLSLPAPLVNKRKAPDGFGDNADHGKKTKRTEDPNANKMELYLELSYKCLKEYLSGSGHERSRSATELVQMIERVVNHSPNSFAGTMLKEMQALKAVVAKQQELVHRLVGDPEFNIKTVFPKTPLQSSVNETWADFRQQILETVDMDRNTPTPTPVAAGYLSRCMEDIASSRVPAHELPDYIMNTQMYLVSPHAQQAVLGALFCRWVFQLPEPMCKDHHPKAMMKYLAALSTKGDGVSSGLDQVQHADKLVAQEMFVDPDEQRTTVQSRQQELLENLAVAAKLLFPTHNSPIREVPEDFAAKAVKLKHALMLSPMDYRIHFSYPDVKFDPTWMQAYDEENLHLKDAQAAGKNIALCLFPALLTREAESFADDATMEDALVKNKRFFPSPSEIRTFDPRQCIAKAVVLVL